MRGKFFIDRVPGSGRHRAAASYNRTCSNPLPQFAFSSLKLHLSQAAGTNVFTAYGERYVAVNGARYARSLLVLPDRVVADWGPDEFDALGPEHLAALVGFAPEVVLLGTGERLRFPRPEVTRALVEARIGLEVMDVQAACRTFNILAAEGRKVAAALVLE
jgi:uncharacterized protein